MHPAAGWPQQAFSPPPKRRRTSIVPVVLVVVVLGAVVGVGVALHPWRKSTSETAGVADSTPGGGASDAPAPVLGSAGSTAVVGSEPSPNVSHGIRDLSEGDLLMVLPQTFELNKFLIKEGGPPLVWRLTGTATQSANGPAQPSDCAPGSPPVIGWASVQYALLDANGGIHGQASIHVQKMASNRAADAFVNARRSQKYAECVGEKHAADLRIQTSGGTVGKATVRSLKPDGYSVTWLFTTPYTINGTPCVDYDDIWIRAIERYILVADVDTCGEHFNQFGESSFVAAAGGDLMFPDREHD